MYSKKTLENARKVGQERLKLLEEYNKQSQTMKQLCRELLQNIEFEKDLRRMEDEDIFLGQIVFAMSHNKIAYTLIIDEVFDLKSYDTKSFGSGGSAYHLFDKYVMKD